MDDEQNIADNPGVAGLAQLGRNAIERVTELERELAAVTAERDARLIAAAPELAEALKGILEAAPDFASHIAAIDKARAALAKAGVE